MPTLADIYSAIDTAKRRGGDFLQNPGTSLQQMLGNANDRARALNEQDRAATDEFLATRKLNGPLQMQSAMDMAGAYNPIGMTAKLSEYGMSHRPMTIQQGAAPLHDLSNAFDDTIYSKAGLQNYGTGSPRLDQEALRIFGKVKGNPEAEVTIYRAVPKGESVKKINPGDWVTVSKEYAMEHGEGTLGGKYKIISQKVPAKHVTTNADSILEQGYYPE
jgi:hypothetical protein